MKKQELYDLLASISVTNGYLGKINALTAWSTNAVITQNDIRKVRAKLKKRGYSLHVRGGIMYNIVCDNWRVA